VPTPRLPPRRRWWRTGSGADESTGPAERPPPGKQRRCPAPRAVRLPARRRCQRPANPENAPLEPGDRAPRRGRTAPGNLGRGPGWDKKGDEGQDECRGQDRSGHRIPHRWYEETRRRSYAFKSSRKVGRWSRHPRRSRLPFLWPISAASCTAPTCRRCHRGRLCEYIERAYPRAATPVRDATIPDGCVRPGWSLCSPKALYLYCTYISVFERF